MFCIAYPSMFQKRIKIERPYSFKALLVCAGFDYDRGSHALAAILPNINNLENPNDPNYYTLSEAAKLILPRHPNWGEQMTDVRCKLCLTWVNFLSLSHTQYIIIIISMFIIRGIEITCLFILIMPR